MHKIGRILKKFVKHKKPEICMAAGTILAGAAIVTACVKTANGGSDILKDHKDRLAKAKAMSDDDPDKKKEITKVYGTTLLTSVRVYAGPSVLFLGSIAAFWAAHHTMKIRNAGLAAAATAARKTLKDYRSRVAEHVGEDVEENLYFGTKTKEVDEIVTDENGEETAVKKTYTDVVDDTDGSEFVKYFTKGNINWDRSPDMNEFFLKCQESRANDILKLKGEITLNEVYDLLGFPRTEAGMVFGWIYDKYNPFGDNKVEFRAKRVHVPNSDGKGHSLAYALDFNVDGNIYEEKIKRRGLKSFRKR